MNPGCKYFYDLFGGGGAISFEALQRRRFKKVFYNELNTDVVELLKKIRDDGVTDEFYEWIDRDTFWKLKDGDDWKAGLVKTCWSFGNNSEKGYLYGKDIEELKKKATYYLFNNGYLESKDKAITRVKLLKEFNNIYKLQLQSIQQLEQLEQLERLERLERLEIQNKSYDEVVIDTPIDETIIYLDPPYNTTTKYQNTVDFKKLYKWIKKSPYKIYISEYNLPMFNEVMIFKHCSTLSSTNNSKVVYEKLYCNKKESRRYWLFD
jgi:site-specific DNA-adenine methylase